MLTSTTEKIIIVLSAEASDAVAGLEVFEWIADESFAITEVAIQCDSDNPPTGSAAQIDVNKGGTSIFSTNPTIDAGEYHSGTAATASVLSSNPTQVSSGDILTFDIDQIGSTNAGRGYKVTLSVIRPLQG